MDTLKKILIKPVDQDARRKAVERVNSLTMPTWALGRLLDLGVDLCGMTGKVPPPVARKRVFVMAGDHGVVAEGVSPYPQEVTGQMVRNFLNGGAGVNVLARLQGADVTVADFGMVKPLTDAPEVVDCRIGAGTGNIARQPAMTSEQARLAVCKGIELAQRFADQVDVFATGEMGIGNTTPASAIVAAVSGFPVAGLVGRGAGVDDAGLSRKARVIEQALHLHQPDPRDGLDILAKVGGFEIGGIAGLVIGAASLGKPVLVDGMISTAGAVLAKLIRPASVEYMITTHKSAEPGHRTACGILGREPLLDLGLRLGEGTGAALAMNLVEAAARILAEMATFSEAKVSSK